MKAAKMDESEKLVHRYLVDCGFTEIVYEPDGNVPPDFLVDGRIAVEVRRLNQNYVSGIVIEGLEEVAIPLWHKIENLVEKIRPSTQANCYFVFYKFRRPVEPWDTLRVKLKSALQKFCDNPTDQLIRIPLGNDFELSILRSQTVYPTFFVMGSRMDQDAGGWVLSETLRNLQLCIDEKTQKIANFISKYPEWWLVLADHVGYSLDDDERNLLLEHDLVSHSWDRIILIDPRDHTRAFRL